MKIKKQEMIILSSSIVLFLLNFFLKYTYTLIFWILIPLIISYFLKLKPTHIGLKLFPKKEIPLIVGLFLLGSGIAFYSSFVPDMMSYYSFYTFDLSFLVWWTITLIAVEFFFRGYMLFGLERVGKFSILIQSIPYMLIHLGKPWPEFYFSFFAGIVFGLVNWRSKSFLPSFLIHLAGLEIVYLASL